MSQQLDTKKVWVAGIYNWPAISTKEDRIKDKNYPRHNWCDIDVLQQERFDSVLEVYKKYNIDVVSQRLGKGWHFLGDLVDFDTWLKIWLEIKPYADPNWPPHCMRLSKKKENEVFEKPIYHKHKNDPPKWSRALMSFLCKTIRNDNPDNLWTAMHRVGLDKYFQVTVYPVELK